MFNFFLNFSFMSNRVSLFFLQFIYFSLIFSIDVSSTPIHAGLLSPLLRFGRPRLERRLVNKCVELTAGDNAKLVEKLRPVCTEFSKPLANCLIKHTDDSGLTFGVLVEILRGEFGDDSETVVKLCSASMLNLPSHTFMNVPLLEIVDYWKNSSVNKSLE